MGGDWEGTGGGGLLPHNPAYHPEWEEREMRQWDSGRRGHWGSRITHLATEMLNVADVSDTSVLIMTVSKMSWRNTPARGTSRCQTQRYFRHILDTMVHGS